MRAPRSRRGGPPLPGPGERVRPPGHVALPGLLARARRAHRAAPRTAGGGAGVRVAHVAVVLAVAAGWGVAAWLLLDTVVPGELALPPVDVDGVFGRGARRRRGTLRAVPPRRLGRRPGRCARDPRLLRPVRRPLRARVGRRADRHRDAPRDARARDRLAHAAALRDRGRLVGAPSRRLRGGLPRSGRRRVARARRDLRRDLHRAPRRDGARAVARELVVDPGSSRLHRDRVGSRADRPVPRPRPREAGRRGAGPRLRALRALAGRQRHPAPDRGGQRRHEPGERVRVRHGADLDDRPLGHAPRRQVHRRRGACRPRPRARASLERPPARGGRVVRALRAPRRPAAHARDAAPRRHGRGRRRPARPARRRGLPARRGAGPERRQPRVGGRGGLEGARRRPATPRPRGGCSADSAETSLGDPSPPTWAYVLLQTHPTLAQRVAMAEAWAAARADRRCPTEVGRLRRRALRSACTRARTRPRAASAGRPSR